MLLLLGYCATQDQTNYFSPGALLFRGGTMVAHWEGVDLATVSAVGGLHVLLLLLPLHYYWKRVLLVQHQYQGRRGVISKISANLYLALIRQT